MKRPIECEPHWVRRRGFLALRREAPGGFDDFDFGAIHFVELEAGKSEFDGRFDIAKFEAIIPREGRLERVRDLKLGALKIVKRNAEYCEHEVQRSILGFKQRIELELNFGKRVSEAFS